MQKITEDQMQDAVRLWLIAEGFDPDADDAHLTQAAHIAWFMNNHNATKYTRSFVKKAMRG
jgi:hypothetical protein